MTLRQARARAACRCRVATGYRRTQLRRRLAPVSRSNRRRRRARRRHGEFARAEARRSRSRTATTPLRLHSFPSTAALWLLTGAQAIVSFHADAVAASFWRSIRRAIVPAQTPTGGTIAGVVLDGAGRPVRDADVFALPEKARASTDSTGRFTITNLGSGFYHVRVRRLGFRPTEITTDLANNGHVDSSSSLRRAPRCSTASSFRPTENALRCRSRDSSAGAARKGCLPDRRRPRRQRRDRAWRGVRRRQRISTSRRRPTRYGLMPIPFATRGGCINALVNGRPLR